MDELNVLNYGQCEYESRKRKTDVVDSDSFSYIEIEMLAHCMHRKYSMCCFISFKPTLQSYMSKQKQTSK